MILEKGKAYMDKVKRQMVNQVKTLNLGSARECDVDEILVYKNIRNNIKSNNEPLGSNRNSLEYGQQLLNRRCSVPLSHEYPYQNSSYKDKQEIDRDFDEFD